MPEITLRTTAAGPGGVLYPGKHTVDDATAAALIAGGYAVGDAPIEAAALEPAETAAQRPARARRG